MIKELCCILLSSSILIQGMNGAILASHQETVFEEDTTVNEENEANLEEMQEEKEQLAEGQEIFLKTWAGPGDQYLEMTNESLNKATSITRIENNWAEVDFSGNRKYVPLDSVEYLVKDSTPRVIWTADQKVYPYPTIFHFKNTSLNSLINTQLFSSPEMKNKISTISAGDTVYILSLKDEDFLNRKIAYIETEKNNKKIRGYTYLYELMDLNNPLNGYIKASKTNAFFELNGKDYLSTTGIDTSFDGWKTINTQSIIGGEIDWVAGVTGIIADNDIDDETLNVTGSIIELQSAKTGKYYNASPNGRSGPKLVLSIADFFISSFNSFVSSGDKRFSLRVNELEYKNYHKITIRTGEPFESPYAGKTLSLSELISNSKGNTALSIISSSKDADEMIHKMYPEISESSKCSMTLNFSKDFSDNPYGYEIFFDKNFDLYGLPIIHPGTSFIVYVDGKPYKDATLDLAQSLIQYDEKSKNEVIKALEKKGYHLKGNQSLNLDQTLINTTTFKMYRLYNPNSGEHFYTSDNKEKSSLVSLGWIYEGIGWNAPKSSSTPVYRLYNENAGDHHYTPDIKERDALVKLGWKYEKIGWYSDDQKGLTLYRLYNPNATAAGAHHYTPDKLERDSLVSQGWKHEGVAWYGVKTLPNNVVQYNGHHYYIYADVCSTWEEAKSYCESLGGHLAIINDEAENTFLFDLMKKMGYVNAYFGLFDLNKNGDWKWIDGSTPKYLNWAKGEPNRERNKEYIGMFYYKTPDYQWNDGDYNNGTVNDDKIFICEWNY